ncbi:MAG: DUF6166 domain-containing protein [Verrucomicrobiales bacterium]|nr:DUF6166 domain-containing protein [Verrucomicrobiales bacterium]
MLQNSTLVRTSDSWPESASGLSLPLMEARLYRGERLSDGDHNVWFEDRGSDKENQEPERHTLPLHLEVRVHSPTGFAWGYGGSGPAQLALALLVHATGDSETALLHYQAFKWGHVAHWGDRWTITGAAIRSFVERQQPEVKEPGGGCSSPVCEARFPIGRLLITPGALDVLTPAEVQAALSRHVRGDWGDVDAADRISNDHALKAGLRLFSVYRTRAQATFWIITEATREVTTILLPADY